MPDTSSVAQPPARPAKGKSEASETGEFLVMSFEPGEEGTKVRLIGSYPGRCLLITAPKVDGSLVFVKEGQLLYFRSFYAQAIYNFAASVQKLCFTPFPYILIDWPKPETIERTVVRRSRRVDVKLPCAVYWDLDGTTTTVSGMIRNLSVEGAELHMNRPIPPRAENTRLAFQLALGSVKTTVECKIKVMRHSPITGKNNVTIDEYGLLLQELPQEMFFALYAYVHEMAAARLETPLYAQATLG